jgi:hypothetical protein
MYSQPARPKLYDPGTIPGHVFDLFLGLLLRRLFGLGLPEHLRRILWFYHNNPVFVSYQDISGLMTTPPQHTGKLISPVRLYKGRGRNSRSVNGNVQFFQCADIRTAPSKHEAAKTALDRPQSH